ncbi:MAG: extracellular solute-binding protein [Tepidisphaeraceae bacterium]
MLCVLCGEFALCGCDKPTQKEVVLYTSIDQPVAAPIIREFEKQTGIHVTLVTDSEASKSVGLAERLRAERANPQADVWWSNEPFHTINLAEEGVLEAWGGSGWLGVPERFRDPNKRWACNGVRVRVIAVSGPAQVGSLLDLTRPELKDRIAMARPTAGTTGGHVAALFVLWGDDAASEYFRKLRANNIKLLGGNSAVAEAVGRGQLFAGLTDNDDCAAVLREGGTLNTVLPDQDGIGTLLVPTSVGMVNGCKHMRLAERLIEFLLSKEVEQELMDAKFAYGSVRPGIGPQVKAMDVDYPEVARKMPEAVRRATAILEGRE